MMQKAIVCNMDEKFLECGTEFSDRFVFSYYFVPRNIVFDDDKTPILPEYKKWWLLYYHMSDPLWILKLKDLAEKHKIPLPDLLQKNKMILPPTSPSPRSQPGIGPRTGTVLPMKGKIKDFASDVKELTTLLKGKVLESDRGIVDLIERKIREIDTAVEAAPGIYDTPAESEKMMNTYSTAEVAMVAPTTALQQAQEIDFFLNALKSDVGYLFLDRTRIRPKGFAIGEHVYALSLAPGEEVVLEQKTFSKRSKTFEEQTEEERQFDLELSSTLTNEIQEGFERQTSLTDVRGFQVGGQVGAQIKMVNINANSSYSRNITEANNQTKTRSVKQSQTASSKTASKYRTMHKVTFKISTEEGFESTSKRVIKSPNKYTPIDLHYFKIMRVHEMSQERYGVRLCWAPYIKDPAIAFLTRIKEGRDRIIKDEEKRIQLPPEPPRPAGKIVPSITKLGRVKVDKWDFDGSTPNSSADRSYKIEIPIPDGGYNWNFDINKLKSSIRLDTAMKRSAYVEPDGDPYLSDGKVVIPFRVTVSARPLWAWRVVAEVVAGVTLAALPLIAKLGVAGAWVAALVAKEVAEEDKDAMNEWSPVYVQAEAQFDPDPATNSDLQAYKAELDKWQTKHDDWKKTRDDLLKDALKEGINAADRWEEEMKNKLNPVAEMINIIINKYFTSSVRDEGWEIDLWQKIFDWDSASYVLYPSWWSGPELRDPTKETADFFNASWARLYLPVKIGKINGTSIDRLALRWIFDKVTDIKLGDPVKEKIFAEIEKELDTYRKNHFGDDQETNIVSGEEGECPEFEEKYLCLARWKELMPTDGTHIEVIQSMTSAADQISKNEADDANKLRNAMIESEKQDVELKKKALIQITQPASVEVKINTEGRTGGGGS